MLDTTQGYGDKIKKYVVPAFQREMYKSYLLPSPSLRVENVWEE